MLFKWFADDLKKSNSEKCYSVVRTNANITIKIGYFEENNTRFETLLGVKFDHRLTFDDHM